MVAESAGWVLLLVLSHASVAASRYLPIWAAALVTVGCVLLCLLFSFLFVRNVNASLRQLTYNHAAISDNKIGEVKRERIRSILPVIVTAHESFFRMVDELKDCQPFMPDEDTRSESSHNPLAGRVQPPVGIVTLAFTDIEDSSALWQTYPNQMYTAIHMHHAAVRKCYSRFNAYEVKTIGDAFMLAFDSAFEACGFCLSSQESLLRQEWPADLFEHRACRKISDSSGVQVFGGLRVRMGVHTGEVAKVQDPVTGRADYYGSTVNKAARVESSVVGGGIAVTDEVLQSITDKENLRFTSVVLGEVDLKGVGVTRITSILPPELGSRQPYITLTQKTPTPEPTPAPDTMIRVEISPTEKSKRRFTKGRLGQHKMNAKKLSTSKAAIAFTRIGYARRCGLPTYFEKYSYMLSCVERSVERTGGATMSCVGDAIMSMWKSSNQSIQGARFTGLVNEDLSKEGRVHIGLANGLVLSGTVDAGSRKYRTVIGVCVEMAAALAEEAEHLEAHTLIPSSYVSSTPVIAGFVRPVGMWNMIGNDIPSEILELRADSLNETNKWSWMLGSEMAYENWSGDEYREAFDAAFSEKPDLRLLKSLSQEWESDVVLKNVISNLEIEPQRVCFTSGEGVDECVKDTLHPNYQRSKCSGSTRSSRHEGGFYTMHEVEENGYVVVSGIVHDISSFVATHPGGGGKLREFVGRDITDAFLEGDGSGHKHSGNAKAILATMRIGRLEEVVVHKYTEEHRTALLKEQWKTISEMGTQDLGNRMLSAFISFSPEAAALWGLEDGDIFNPVLHKVAKKMVDMMEAAIEDFDGAKKRLQGVGTLHRAKGVQDRDYENMKAALHNALYDYLGARYTSEAQHAWETLYNSIIKEMQGPREPSRALLKARTLLRFSKASRLSPFAQGMSPPTMSPRSAEQP